MTALSQYARLETVGLWRTNPLEGGREVVVSFGNATLVLADGSGLPLTHWSLPAVTRLNPGLAPALFAPDEDGSETLEIEDDLMVSAIEKVRRSVARTRPASHRQGLRAVWIALGITGLGLLLWLPGVLRREALSVVPPSKRTEIGATLLGHLQRDLGPACRDPQHPTFPRHRRLRKASGCFPRQHERAIPIRPPGDSGPLAQQPA